MAMEMIGMLFGAELLAAVGLTLGLAGYAARAAWWDVADVSPRECLRFWRRMVRGLLK